MNISPLRVIIVSFSVKQRNTKKCNCIFIILVTTQFPYQQGYITCHEYCALSISRRNKMSPVALMLLYISQHIFNVVGQEIVCVFRLSHLFKLWLTPFISSDTFWNAVLWLCLSRTITEFYVLWVLEVNIQVNYRAIYLIYS